MKLSIGDPFNCFLSENLISIIEPIINGVNVRTVTPYVVTTDEVNAEVVRKSLRDPRSLEGKKKGSLFLNS